MVVLALIVFSVPLGRATVLGPVLSSWTDLPSDTYVTNVQTISAAPYLFTNIMGGAIDGEMFFGGGERYSYDPLSWQPDRSVLIENVGDTDVRNPWISVNVRRLWRSLSEIADQVGGGYTNPADRARAFYEFLRVNTFHWSTGDFENRDVVKLLNVYGYAFCDGSSVAFSDLCRAAGIPVRRGYPVAHATTEVYFDGGFHTFDADQKVFYLLRDNTTIAAETDFTRDHDLIKRTHHYGQVNWGADEQQRYFSEWVAALFLWDDVRDLAWAPTSSAVICRTPAPTIPNPPSRSRFCRTGATVPPAARAATR